MPLAERKSNGRKEFFVERVSFRLIPEAKHQENFSFGIRSRMIILLKDRSYSLKEIKIIAKTFREDLNTVGSQYDLGDIISKIQNRLI